VLHGSASYTDSSNDTLVSGQYKTSRYSAFPRKLVQLNIGYRFDHDIELTAANTLMHDATEGIGSPSNDFSETRLTTYWRTDIHISKLLQPGTSVALHVTNLFNRENWRPSVFNTENGLEDSGRTVSIAANHSF